MKLNILHIVCIVAIFQSLLLAIFLFTTKKGKKIGNVILGFWFLSFTVIMSCSLFVSYDFWHYFKNYKELLFTLSQIELLIGPLFYFYVRSLLDENFCLRKKDLIHVLPFILVVSSIMFQYIFWGNFPIWRSFSHLLSNIIFLIQNLTYYILILKLSKLHKFSIQTFPSDKRDLKYNWIRFLIIGLLIIWVTKLQILIFRFIPFERWPFYISTTFVMGLFLFTTSIVYLFLRIPVLFSFNKRYIYSSLSKKDKDKTKNKLLEYMNDKKIYLEQNLSLDILANRLKIPREHLSQIINEKFHQNFNDFVNQYRVKECIDRLKEGNKGEKTLLRIAFECGFNAKSTFNSAFKKFTGLTPKQFRENYHLNKNYNIK